MLGLKLIPREEAQKKPIWDKLIDYSYTSADRKAKKERMKVLSRRVREVSKECSVRLNRLTVTEISRWRKSKKTRQNSAKKIPQTSSALSPDNARDLESLENALGLVASIQESEAEQILKMSTDAKDLLSLGA